MSQILIDRIKDNAVSMVSAICVLAGGAAQANQYIPPVSIPEQMLGDLQVDLDLKEFQAIGVLGNLAQETGNFTYMQEMNPIVKGSRGGAGYSQWTGDRRDAFEAYAANHGGVFSYDANYGFLVKELTGEYSDVLENLRETETLTEATRVFMKQYLRPSERYAHFERRMDYAQAYTDADFSGAGCLTDAEVIEKWGRAAIQECAESLAKLRPEMRPDDLMAGFPEALQVAQTDEGLRIDMDYLNITLLQYTLEDIEVARERQSEIELSFENSL